MHAPEIQHDESVGGNPEPLAIAARYRLRRFQIDAVRHDRDRHAELQIADRVGFLL